MRKMRYMYAVEYYSAVKKSEMMPSVATCRHLETVILSETGQTQKDKYHVVALTCGI